MGAGTRAHGQVPAGLRGQPGRQFGHPGARRAGLLRQRLQRLAFLGPFTRQLPLPAHGLGEFGAQLLRLLVRAAQVGQGGVPGGQQPFLPRHVPLGRGQRRAQARLQHAQRLLLAALLHALGLPGQLLLDPVGVALGLGELIDGARLQAARERLAHAQRQGAGAGGRVAQVGEGVGGAEQRALHVALGAGHGAERGGRAGRGGGGRGGAHGGNDGGKRLADRHAASPVR
ncbi:MAG: hypothetical protein ABT02_10630 [Comamonadaceae bacterium SCN 68-20]|nr:MAG: hypothetical protein ABT02_10630 [Comamonadaceae bacterium SCN 68-20]